MRVIRQLLSLLGFKGGRSPRWRAVRRAFLKANPFCRACGRRTRLDVHHELPISFPGGRERELDEMNLITLCREHHFWHGHGGDWRACVRTCREDAERMLGRVMARSYPPPMMQAQGSDFRMALAWAALLLVVAWVLVSMAFHWWPMP